MACDAVLGEALYQVEVTDATILGGTTMRAYVADYTRLGSGDLPWSAVGETLDEVDVADLESEAAHGYALAGATTGEQTAHAGEAPDGRAVVDGGRLRRTRERFTARLRPGAALVTRLDAVVPTRVHLLVEGAEIGTAEAPAEDWTEVTIDADVASEAPRLVELVFDAPVTVFHHWVVARAH
jgi:hypothetical protein